MDVTGRLKIPIYDLGCGGGGSAEIERELAATDGVRRAYVNPVTEIAYVDFDPTETDAAAIARAIERAGHRAGPPIDA